MSNLIEIKIGNECLKAKLNDSKSAMELYNKLPLSVDMSRWGDEYYGSCGLTVGLGPDAKVIMEVGELAVWPTGNALCIFFGPTPVSTDERPRAAADVNPIGKLLDSPEVLKLFGHSVNMEISAI